MFNCYHRQLFAPVDSDTTGSGSDAGGIDSGGDGVSSSGNGIDSDDGGIGSSGGGVLSARRMTAAAFTPIPVADSTGRRTDLNALHPYMRAAAGRLLALCKSEQLPFRLFEAYRAPARQAWLYSQGRTRAGNVVTYAQPWESYHQYGLAADFVLWINNQWSWVTDGSHQFFWKRLREIGESCGLEGLKFEIPHLQVANLMLTDLGKGVFPEGGDDAWWDNLEANIISWKGEPAAPAIQSPRPELPPKAN
jgi:peptidoglycan L-alanyl-D-glutamate endopeptidase CwlK